MQAQEVYPSTIVYPEEKQPLSCKDLYNIIHTQMYAYAHVQSLSVLSFSFYTH